MLETEDMINQVLDIGGIELTFDSFTILAIIGFSTSLLFRNDEVISGTENQDFNFRTSNKLCLDNEIIEGMVFTMEDNVYRYTFKTANNPIPQMDNWSRIPAYYINKEYL